MVLFVVHTVGECSSILKCGLTAFCADLVIRLVDGTSTEFFTEMTGFLVDDFWMLLEPMELMERPWALVGVLVFRRRFELGSQFSALAPR